eukprot:10799268-Ditylum_brightwellii.AAC.1
MVARTVKSPFSDDRSGQYPRSRKKSQVNFAGDDSSETTIATENIPGKKRSCREVDAFQNPTELFQWINYGDWESAISTAVNFPLEASTWIVSTASSDAGRRDSGKIKWRYLPLHLVCMQPKASSALVQQMLKL